jgi:accessory gene regulator protein AgrB
MVMAVVMEVLILEMVAQAVVQTLALTQLVAVVVLELLLLDMLNRRYRWHTLHN